MSKKDGGPAYPMPEIRGANGEMIQYMEGGMSFRDACALVAAQGFIASNTTCVQPALAVAKYAWRVADAMVAERGET